MDELYKWLIINLLLTILVVVLLYLTFFSDVPWFVELREFMQSTNPNATYIGVKGCD